VNDHRNRSWPGQEPDAQRHTQWPTGDEAPQWPSGDEPARRPRQAPRQSGPQWPSADDQAPRWPGGGDPDGGRGTRHVRQTQQPGPQGRRPPGPPGGPPPGAPPGGPPRGRPPQQAPGTAAYRNQQQPGPPNRRSHAEQPTGYVGQAATEEPREPGLLTHDLHNGTADDGRRGYDDYDDWPSGEQARFNDFGRGGSRDYDDDGGKAELSPRQIKKRRWKIVRRVLYSAFGLFVVLPAVAFTISYFFVDVPTPEEVAARQNQVVTYFFADGSEMGKEVPPGGNRQLLKPEEIPDVAKHAAYAAEDATFETNNGFDVKGIMGAVWNNVSGGTGGGSTISQQYVKKATENEDPTLTRKFTELVKSFKMNQTQDKRDIITAYLNTIYFGRGANGIQTAAQAYFGKDAKDLNYSESAFLAGIIQGPGRSGNSDYTQKRWSYVLDQMLAHNWITKADRANAKFPTLIPADAAKPQTITGPNALIQQRVKAELEAKGYPEEKIQAGGFKIYTTIDPRAQKVAEDTVNDVMKGQPDDLKRALVAVDPKTGGVSAYYGGPNTKEDAADGANTPRNPGSSFKPFDLVALLQRNKGLGETYTGKSGQRFGPPGAQTQPIGNVTECDADPCTVAEGMEKSVNSVFVDMVVDDVHVPAVMDAAKSAGIPDTHGKVPSMADGDYNIAIGGGHTNVTVTDMAGAYATFAADGIRRDQHFVAKVTTPGDETVLDTSTDGKPAFAEDPEKSKQIAGNVTKSLVPVVPHSHLDCPNAHDCAGKTGTQQAVGGKLQDNNQAWMVGYTPSISAASWVGTFGGPNIAIIDAKTKKPIYGSGLPGQMWQKFLQTYLQGKPGEKFADVKPIGKQPAPPPPPPSSPTPTPTPTPSTPPSTPPTTTSSSEPSTTTTRTSKPGFPFDPGNGNGGLFGNNGNGGAGGAQPTGPGG
jgi:membrane peptidoglycan carboxypeptidase